MPVKKPCLRFQLFKCEWLTFEFWGTLLYDFIEMNLKITLIS